MQGIRVHVGHFPVKQQVDGPDRFVGQLPDKGAEMICEFHPGAHDLGFFSGDRGHVDRVGHGASQQEVRHLLGHLDGHVLLRLRRRGAQMRRHDDVRQVEERRTGRGFLGKHVKRRACHMSRFERLGQRDLVDQSAARAVDHAHPGLHPLYRASGKDVPRLVGQRHMKRDEVGPGQQRVQIDLLDAKLFGTFLGKKRIMCDHLHPQPARARDDDRADVAGADHAKRLGCQLHPEETRLFPIAGVRRDVCRRDLAGDREHQGNRMLGGGDRIAERRVHHDHALLGRGGNIHVVDANSCATYNGEPGCRVEEFRGHLGRRPYGQPVVLADCFKQLILVLSQLRFERDVHAPVLEYSDRCLGKIVAYQYPWCHCCLFLSRLHMQRGCRPGASPWPANCAKSRPQASSAGAEDSRISDSNAQSSHGHSAFRSSCSTVPPHQILRPGGASR